jgi:hypothetical protein
VVSVRSSGWNQSFTGTRKQQFYETVIPLSAGSFEKVFTARKAFNLKLVPGRAL